MKNSTYDVIIIGGGINGAGIARDATERGLSVYLAEKHDFAFGTTFRSTKLIHGGLRYLEYYEIGLVRESLRERETLLHLAPHLVKPVKFVIPIYEDNQYGYGKVKLGLLAYDILSYDKSLKNHTSFGCGELHSIEPNIRKQNCNGGFTYYDCQVEYPERLCLMNLMMAKSGGAQINNYTEVVDFIKMGNEINGVIVRDVFTGEEKEIYGKIIINASGPWVDEVLKLHAISPKRKMGGTKGTHLLLPKFPSGPHHAIYVPTHQDGRPFFIIPWRDYYWVGTTDIRFTNNLDDVRSSREEIDYLLREVNFVFPLAGITTQDIIYCIAGVRPLPVTSSETEEAEITRKHIIFDHEDEGLEGLISIIGGKLTTYRNLAEETVDLIFKKLERDVSPCTTGEQPILGGDIDDIEQYRNEAIQLYARKTGFSAEQIAYLISLYGTNFKQIIHLAESDPKLAQPISDQHPAIVAQIIFAIKHEFARTLADIYIRRTGVGISPGQGLDSVKTGAKIMGKYFNWRRKRVKQEIKQYKKTIESMFWFE